MTDERELSLVITYKNILEVDGDTQEKVRLWRNSPRVKARMLDQSTISFERHKQWLCSLSEKAGINEVRVAFCCGAPFGIINLRNIDTDVSSCDWGFYVGDKDFLGRKLGQRMLYNVYEWGFVELGINKMYSTVRSDNLKALYSMMQAGNYVEGFLKDHMRESSGELIGIYLIAQFRRDWMKNREKISSWAMIGEI